MYARGAILGLTRGCTKAHIARATLEGIAYQVKDLLDAMEVDSGKPLQILKVDGGASVSDVLMQFQADILNKPIDRPQMVETTAFGTAFLAGLATGVWNDVSDIKMLRKSQRIFEPNMPREEAQKYLREWKKAVERSSAWSDE